MQQPHQTKKFVPIPHNIGNRPDWETRLGYPQLLNMFVGESGSAYCTGGLTKFSNEAADAGTREIHFTTFNGGGYIVVTKNNILRINLDGSFFIIANIRDSGFPVQIDENLQHQVGIVDGRSFWVYDQKSNSLTLMGETEGFSFRSPISIVVLNTVAIVLDRITNSWSISSPNNMLQFPALDNVPQISEQLTQAVGLETLNDNLYIFGSTGVERWVPSTGNNPYLFPFVKDTNYRQDFGAIGTNSIVRGFSEIFFLSSKFTPMILSANGGMQEIASVGTAKIISQYTDVDLCEGNFYSYSGNYFYSMTFPRTRQNWTYCQNSKTWAFNDDLIISAVRTGEVVATSSGLFNLELFPTQSKKRQIRTERITNYKGLEPYRNILNGVEVRIIQGLKQIPGLPRNQNIELTLSIDSQSWLNTVIRPIGLTGERNAVTTWKMNIAAYEFTFLLTYQGVLNFAIEGISAIIK